MAIFFNNFFSKFIKWNRLVLFVFLIFNVQHIFKIIFFYLVNLLIFLRLQSALVLTIHLLIPPKNKFNSHYYNFNNFSNLMNFNNFDILYIFKNFNDSKSYRTYQILF
jgi:hypothetical protein